ncbi:LacI family DNA-binding transcriptional regulator [Rathayibacter sp. VKM Ac-2760]|uniref:LacI family DNA-binding transcriptional regulator n=1 Tax=Rathayibacter sp. VKM Ac-2760 TaxID=2609253 RepID=UPI001316D9FC|nr:LacI family DNA-binding transcriptional regulator [Rathayibacter sp. VKM Ac-2760]QHC58717.1 LacI family DNA-binding transcriptional regulator [Rathayibacter sp. VKM Ac-2760]
MATLADVAALAGVSKATASRTLSRPEVVSPDTAARVLSAAAKLGFIPNSAARQLARGRTGVVALVVPTLDNAFFTPIIGGAQRRADEDGLQLTVAVHPLEAVRELEAFDRLSRQVDGFIVVAPRGSDELLLSAGSQKPTVLVDREVDGITSVVADTASAFGALVERFTADGHERVLYIGGPDGSWQDRQRTAAVRESARRGGAELTVLGPFPATFAAGVGAAAAVRGSGATAVVPYATALGLGVQYALLSSGGVPAGLVVSSERSIVDALGLIGVPAVDVDGEELGRAAASLLIDRLGRKDAPPERRRLAVPVRWRAGP